MSDRVLKLWESYRNEVVPEGAGISQLVETRRAFYAGANALLGLARGARVRPVNLIDPTMCECIDPLPVEMCLSCQEQGR